MSIEAEISTGVTKREYFAARALEGDMTMNAKDMYDRQLSEEYLLERAKFYFRMADAMIAAESL